MTEMITCEWFSKLSEIIDFSDVHGLTTKELNR